MRTRSTLLVASVAALSWTACRPQEQASATTAVSDSSGVRIVVNDSSTIELELTERLRLGVIEGGGPEQFAQIYSLALGTDGRVFVGNNGSRTVRVFDLEGRFLSEFGGRGDGPAEVSTLNDLFVVGDSVALIDWQRGGKVVLFRSDGTFVDNWTVRQPDGRRIQPVHRGPQGWLASVLEGGLPRPAAGEPAHVTGTIHRVDFGSTDVGPPVYEFPVYTLYGMPGGEGDVDWALFRPRSFYGFDGLGRIYITDPQTYRLDIRDDEGTVSSVRRRLPLRRLTSEDVGQLKAATLAVIDTMSAMPDQERAAQRRQLTDRIDRQASLPLPEVVTPLGPVLVSADGSFWVEVVDTSRPAQREADQMFRRFGSVPLHDTRWDLFNSEGIYRGTAMLPPRFRAEAVDDLVVAGVWVDDLDIEYVRVFEVTPS